MTTKFGMTSWDEVEISAQKGKRYGNDTFLKLKEGDNRVRIITKPYQFLAHRFKAPKDPGFGVWIKSSLPNGKDPLADKGSKPKMRWYLGVIDRYTQSYKILEIGQTVFKSIQNLARDEDWGDPTQYDINIEVDKNGGAAGYYRVNPKPKKPLSAEDLEIKQNSVDLDVLQQLTTPPTPEDMQKRIDAIVAKSGFAKNNPSTSTDVETPDAAVSEDEFPEFPAADSES